MIMQTFKTWFRKLFAFACWPWKHSSQVRWHSSPANAGSRNTSQGPLWATTSYDTEPALSWSEGTSVAVEQEMIDLDVHEPPEMINHKLSNSPTRQPRSHTTNRLPPHPTNSQTSTTNDETHEKQLEFLRFLVKRGVFNEGFPEGQEPDQYNQQ